MNQPLLSQNNILIISFVIANWTPKCIKQTDNGLITQISSISKLYKYILKTNMIINIIFTLFQPQDHQGKQRHGTS